MTKSWKKPTPELVERALLAINDPQQARYFYRELKNPLWLSLLEAQGVYKQAPEPIHNLEKGTISFPDWPEGYYLIEAASKNPNLIIQIAGKLIVSDNPRVLDFFFRALSRVQGKIPDELKRKILQTLKRQGQNQFLFLESLTQFLENYFKNKQDEKFAFEVFNEILKIYPPQDSKDSKYSFLGVQTRLENWDYKTFLEKLTPILFRQNPRQTLQTLANLLKQAIVFETDGSIKNKPYDFSNYWLPAVEDVEDDLPRTEIKSFLATSIRDNLVKATKQNLINFEELRALLECQGWKIFDRFLLFLLREFPKKDKKTIKSWLVNKENFEDPYIQHEYILLLRQETKNLPKESLILILKWVDLGPDMGSWEERFIKEKGRKPKKEEMILRKNHWTNEKLAYFGQDLPEKYQKLRKKLIEKMGKPENLEYSAKISGWVGSESPISSKEIANLKVKEVVEFLKTWEPSKKGIRVPSVDGLGRILQEDIKRRSFYYIKEINEFMTLPPTYGRYLLEALREVVQSKSKRKLAWEKILDFSLFVMNQTFLANSRGYFDEDPGWNWAKKSVLNLLREGLTKKQNKIPIRLRKDVWELLSSSMKMPSPESEEGTIDEPLTLSINSIQGTALNGMVEYCLWVKRNTSEHGPENFSFEYLPEAREFFEKELKHSKNTSLANFSVFGRFFPWLKVLDSDWASQKANKIFPLSAKKKNFWDSSWSAYIGLCKPFDDILPLLYKQYRHAIHENAKGKSAPFLRGREEHHLAGHLMVFYARGLLDQGEGKNLFRYLWNSGSQNLRKESIWFLGRLISQKNGIGEKEIKRFISAWEYLFKKAKTSQNPQDYFEELRAFGNWLESPHLSDDWLIEQLIKVLDLTKGISNEWRILELIGGLEPKDPKKRIKCVLLILKNSPQPYISEKSRKQVFKVAQEALESSNAARRSIALETVNLMGKLGYQEFKTLIN